MAQEQDKEMRQSKVDSGDVSGQGRERRKDEEYTKGRSLGDFGTHGGPNKGKQASSESSGGESEDE